MPHYTLPIYPGIGPVLSVFVGVSIPRHQTLTALGLPIPLPVLVNFLIDTGASTTCVDQSAIAPLGLSPTGSIPMLTPSTGPTAVDIPAYDVSLYVHHEENSKFVKILPIAAVDFSAQPIKGLLGRDFLASCLFVYDGAAGQHAFAF